MNVGESRYELLDLIGSGGMAEVYRARMVGAVGFEKLVAIKRLLPHVNSDQEFVQRFIDEARLTARLVHPNICQILDFGVMDDCYFITMEYVDGLDLAGVLKGMEREGERIPVDVALYVICGVLRGLKYAHEATDDNGRRLGIVHRDVSPHNVLLSVNGDVKLSDLGAATANQAYRSTRTQKHYRLGKVLYMAPEQRRRKAVDARADIYSTGILLAEMLLGMSTFHQEANMFLAGMCSLWEKISDHVAPPLGQAFSRVVEHALAEDPTRRYQSADGMLSELEGLLVDYAPGTSVDRVSRFVQRMRRRRPDAALSPSDGLVAEDVRSLHTGDFEEIDFIDRTPAPPPEEARLPDLQFPEDAPAMIEDPAELDDVMTIAKPEMAIRHPSRDRQHPVLDRQEDDQEVLQTTILRKKRPKVAQIPSQGADPAHPIGPPGPNAPQYGQQPSPPYLEMVVQQLEPEPAAQELPSERAARAQARFHEVTPVSHTPSPLREEVRTTRDDLAVQPSMEREPSTEGGAGSRRRTLLFVLIAVPLVLFFGVVFGGLIAIRLFPEEPQAPVDRGLPSTEELISPTPGSPDDPTLSPAKLSIPSSLIKAPTPSDPERDDAASSSSDDDVDAHMSKHSTEPTKSASPREETPPRESTPTEPSQTSHKRSSGYGYLNINATPYGIPYVDGRQISSETPVARYKVPAGRHVVKVRFPQVEQNREQVVNIEPDQTKGIVFSME